MATFRDHYANPRNTAYQLTSIDQLLSIADFSTVDLLVDDALDAGAMPTQGDRFGRIERRLLASLRPSDVSPYDTIVLVYPDALGLTWGPVEVKLARARKRLVVLNGRRRLFTLDRKARRALAWRRFLASSRLPELVAGVILIPIAGTLAVADYLRGRR